ncbi:MAG: hypothetical protein U9O96_03490 [Candidatus Thermoplasmatota archaeon]|nr:hypothetical protein [Candidatus Thermoplasmatota archaeon]
MEGNGDENNNKKAFSGNGVFIIAVVMALIIFSAVVSAYPRGMNISKMHSVIYSGNDDVILSGKIGIGGTINGIAISKNISKEQFLGVDEIIINGKGTGEKRFFNTNLIITGGNGEINLSANINESLDSAIVFFDSSNETSIGIITKDTIYIQCYENAVLNIEGGNVSVGNGTWEEGGDFNIILKGDFDACIETKIFGISTDGEMNVSMKKGNVFDDKLLDALDIELPPLPFDMNGACVISGGTVFVDGTAMSIKNLSFFRGDGTAVINKSVYLNAKAILLTIDGNFYNDEKGTMVWFIPDKIIGLWPIAIATWIIIYFVRKKFSTKIGAYDKGMGGVAAIIHLLCLAISFYLWDWEIRHKFGKSILSVATTAIQDGMGIQEWIVAPFELIPWFAAMVLIAIPVRIIFSSVFSLIGLEKVGKGAGKATGLLLLFFVGVIYIPFFLNVTIAPLIKSFVGW